MIRIGLPDEEAQTLYLTAYNKAWTEAGSREPAMRDDLAHQAGWTAVEAEYVLDESQGRWYRRQELTENTDEDKGLLDRLKELVSSE